MPLTIALRPYLPSDAPLLADIFRASIEELAAEDYDSGQIDAWVATADDEEAFAAKLAGALTLIASLDGEPAGFASLALPNRIDMLYVAPDAARQRVATVLVDALEKLAAARGVKSLVVEASDTARPFFAARGYIAERRNTIPVGDEWLGNTSMKKDLPHKPETKQ